MATIELKYGSGAIPVEYDPERISVLSRPSEAKILSDLEISERLDRPIGSVTIDEVAGRGSVLIVVPDATREVGCGQIVNIVVRRLIASGTPPHEISIIFATGIHRRVTDEEKRSILTPFIFQRIKTLDHDPRDLARLVNVGVTSGGIPVEVNRALTEFDSVILIGGVSFHYFAGFTGGRKLICPGLASTRTITGTHKLAFDCGTLTRHAGVGAGMLDGNAVHEAFVDAVSFIPPTFAITTITNESGEVVDLYCGDWHTSHIASCIEFDRQNTIEIREKRELVIASCGGLPHDLNLIQAHKTLDAATFACKEGGTIILLAECRDGLGRDDMIAWFDAGTSSRMAERLCSKYQVNGQTAWNLRRIAERFSVLIVTDIDEAIAERTGMRTISGESDDLARHLTGKSAYIIENGKTRYKSISGN